MNPTLLINTAISVLPRAPEFSACLGIISLAVGDLFGSEHNALIFDLLQKLRHRRDAEHRANSPDNRQGAEDHQPFDPNNPFPEPVIIPFRDVLDLHSIPPGQVRAVVEDYIDEAHTRGVRFVRIIHGKGIGVQREMIRSILSPSAFVIDYSDAPADAGGWGATIVTLKIDDTSPAAKSSD